MREEKNEKTCPLNHPYFDDILILVKIWEWRACCNKLNFLASKKWRCEKCFSLFLHLMKRKNIFLMSKHIFPLTSKEHFCSKHLQKDVINMSAIIMQSNLFRPIIQVRFVWSWKNADKFHLYFILLTSGFKFQI